jgi:hypothetical protein
MYIECKGGEFVETVFEGGGISKLSRAAALTGPARIGRVTFSRTGATMYYQGKSFERLKAKGFKSNYYDIETGEHYWISGPKRRGGDALYATNINAEIDEDVREEYWTQIRNQPELKNQKHT